MGTGTKSRAGLLVWRSGVLSRTLDRRGVRSVLDTDANWERMELRSMNDEVRRRKAQGQSVRELGRSYNVSPNTISRVR
jgi:hypothetical protein